MNASRFVGFGGMLMLSAVLFTSQARGTDTISTLAEMNVCGPRVGMFVVLDTGLLYKELEKHDGSRAISQFGWHFELKFTPVSGGPAFLLQMVPLVAGVEYGMFIPSLSFPIGIRLPFGTEFGMGPSFAVGNAEHPLSSSMIIALGHSFNYKGVGIPINLAFARGPAGNRIGLLLGYAITKQVRKDTQTLER